MPPSSSLPLPAYWSSDDEYVKSLLTFVTTSEIFRNLCGGVHILDFLTREPDLYSTVLPKEWRDWLELVDVHDLLHLLLRADLDDVRQNGFSTGDRDLETESMPPESFLTYVQTIRQHCLVRTFDSPSKESQHMPRHISVGMKPKKIHEVSHFASYVYRLAARVSWKLGHPVWLVDFGSGQNYLGRTLACPPYGKHVVAIERKHHNVEGARGMDVHAKLSKKEKTMRNKKEYKRRMNLAIENGLPTPPPEELDFEVEVPDEVHARSSHDDQGSQGKGSMTYVEHDIQDGHLQQLLSSATKHTPSLPKVITISLHSCGNLSHHALRSLPLNPSVSAVAIIGCCYNLLTERLGPLTYKHPQLRPNHPRLHSTSHAYDPHGFPLSRTVADFSLPSSSEKGVRLNITARMMAVQAPQNWGREDSELFFTRHFYRALLQRILLDLGVVKTASDPDDVAGWNSLSGKDEVGTPLIVGSLRKSCFTSFHAYVRGALEKLSSDPVEGPIITEKTKDLTDEVISRYEQEWAFARKRLAVIWSLMAFSAGVVESVIAVDRWLFLKEQECVQEAWVEAVFDYKESPRNLCVVGIKKAEYVEKGAGSG